MNNSKHRATHYQRHKERLKAESKAGRIARRAKYHEWKESLSCTKCGEDDSVCLEFHHLDPEQKDTNVAMMAHSHSLERILEEVSKCICVCSNCHRKIHAGHMQV